MDIDRKKIIIFSNFMARKGKQKANSKEKVIKNIPSIFPKGFGVDKLKEDIFELEFIDSTGSDGNVLIVSSIVLHREIAQDLIVSLKKLLDKVK